MLLALGQATVGGADPVPISGQAIWAAVIMVALVAVLAWVARRGVSLRRTSQAVKVETAVPLGERRSLVIVSVEGRRLLLGLTPASVSLVTELQKGFAETLDATVGKGVQP